MGWKTCGIECCIRISFLKLEGSYILRSELSHFEGWNNGWKLKEMKGNLQFESDMKSNL